MKKKLLHIIDWKDDQYTPEEMLRFLLEKVGKMERIIVLWSDGELFHWDFGSKGRDWTKQSIYWDMEQLRQAFLTDTGLRR